MRVVEWCDNEPCLNPAGDCSRSYRLSFFSALVVCLCYVDECACCNFEAFICLLVT